MKPSIRGLGFIISAFLVTLLGCKSQKAVTEVVDYHQIVIEKLGDNYSDSYNDSGDMVICVNDEAKVGIEKVDYLIISLDNSQVLYEEFQFMGSITWESDSIIRIKRITGVSAAKNTNAGITYYDIINKVNVDPTNNRK